MKSKKANDELYSKGLRPMLGSDTQTFLSLISKNEYTFSFRTQQPCVFTFNWVELPYSHFFEQQFNSVVTASINWFTCPVHLIRHTLYYTCPVHLMVSLNTLYTQPVSEQYLAKHAGLFAAPATIFTKGGKELKSFKQVAAFYHTLIFIQTTHIGLSIDSDLWYAHRDWMKIERCWEGGRACGL